MTDQNEHSKVFDRISGAVSAFIVGYGDTDNHGALDLVQKLITVQRSLLPDDEHYSECVRQYVLEQCDVWESRDEKDGGMYRRNYEALRKLYSTAQ